MAFGCPLKCRSSQIMNMLPRFFLVAVVSGLVARPGHAQGVDRDKVRAGIGAWLMAHQPQHAPTVTYLAVLVDGDDQAGFTYRLSHGVIAEFPRTDLQFLVARAILDLTGTEEAAAAD